MEDKENNNEDGEDLLHDNFDDENHTKLDDLIKKNVDNKRIKTIDRTKKRAVYESVFDERTVFQLKKILENGPLAKLEGIISAGKEANIYLAYDQNNKEVAIKIYKIDNNTSKWMRSYIIGDPRFKNVPHNVSKTIFLWANKEFKNLKRDIKRV